MESHRGPIEYSESDLEVPEPAWEDLRDGDLVVIRSSVKRTKQENKDWLQRMARQTGKSSIHRLMDMLREPEPEEVGIVIDVLNPDSQGVIEVLWCRWREVKLTRNTEISIVQRA